MEANVYNHSGEKTKTINLPKSVFGLKWNADLVHQVITSMASSARTPVAHTKNRGEVSGGGKKPWKQKGTGRARHGSTRSPIWVGGGVTHGPRNEKNYSRKVNKKMKAKALYTILSEKLKKGELVFVEGFNFKAPKTKDAKAVLSGLSKIEGISGIVSKRKNSAYVAIPAKNLAIEKSFSNFNNLIVDEARNINPIDLMKYRYLIVADPDNTLAQISTKLGNSLDLTRDK